MAAPSGLSKSTIGRIWKGFGLQPHRVDTFKVSNDPQFIDKVRDIVGLYLDPPEKALVLCVDEKSQIQALDRSAPGPPGMPELTHDYLRHGVTTLFAALEVATGQVIGSIHRRHRATEFRTSLAKLDKEIPAELEVHRGDLSKISSLTGETRLKRAIRSVVVEDVGSSVGRFSPQDRPTPGTPRDHLSCHARRPP